MKKNNPKTYWQRSFHIRVCNSFAHAESNPGCPTSLWKNLTPQSETTSPKRTGVLPKWALGRQFDMRFVFTAFLWIALWKINIRSHYRWKTITGGNNGLHAKKSANERRVGARLYACTAGLPPIWRMSLRRFCMAAISRFWICIFSIPRKRDRLKPWLLVASANEPSPLCFRLAISRFRLPFVRQLSAQSMYFWLKFRCICRPDCLLVTHFLKYWHCSQVLRSAL